MAESVAELDDQVVFMLFTVCFNVFDQLVELLRYLLVFRLCVLEHARVAVELLIIVGLLAQVSARLPLKVISFFTNKIFLDDLFWNIRQLFLAQKVFFLLVGQQSLQSADRIKVAVHRLVVLFVVHLAGFVDEEEDGTVLFDEAVGHQFELFMSH